MTDQFLDARVRSAMEEARRDFHVPGIGVAAARDDGPTDTLWLGTDADGRQLDARSLFPVASITKLATALAVLRLIDQGALSLDDPLGRRLPAAAAAQPGVTVRRLLSHTSGLPLDIPPSAAPYAPGLTWPMLARACLGVAPERPPGTFVQYSNVGYGLLALLIEQQVGRPFPAVLSELVLAPLGIEGYLGAEPPRCPARLADIRSEHAGTPLEPFNSPFWRSLALPWGGLITTLEGALRLVHAFGHPPARLLSPALTAEATRNQTGGLSGGFLPPLIWPRCPWGLGPDIRDAKQPHWAPPESSEHTFGHSGASGCAAWLDPARGVAWAIVGTRTADNGWLIRRGPRIGAAVLAAAR